MKISQTIKTLIFAFILAVGAQYAFADWTPAPAGAPANNVDAPVNLSSSLQKKLGALWVNTSSVDPNAIGFVSFGQSLFNGPVKIVDGTQGANKVLTSDASGLASWQNSLGGIMVKRGSYYTSTPVSTSNIMDPAVALTSSSGEQAFTYTYTPLATGHTLVIRVNGYGSTNSGQEIYGLALFKDSDSTPLTSGFTTSERFTGSVSLVAETVTSSASPITFKVRFGGSSNSGMYYFNQYFQNVGSINAVPYGGSAKSSITVEEYSS